MTTRAPRLRAALNNDCLLGRRRFLHALLAGSAGLCGCSSWVHVPTSDNVLPPAMMSPQTVVLEIAFVHLTPDDAAAEADLWRQLDELALPVELRQQLAANGMRAGLAGTLLPDSLRSLVERTAKQLAEAPGGSDVASADTASLARQRRLQTRSGKRGKIVVSTTYPSISVLSKDEQGHVRGDAFTDAQCLFSLIATAQGDGRAILQLTPEIEHGEVKNRWIPVDGALVQQVGKQRHVYDHLRLNQPLTAGQSLVLGPTDPVSGLGQHFFTLSDPTPRRTLLLVRLAQTQLDDLFQPQTPANSLTTETE
jgi:hypothetical protein